MPIGPRVLSEEAAEEGENTTESTAQEVENTHNPSFRIRRYPHLEPEAVVHCHSPHCSAHADPSSYHFNFEAAERWVENRLSMNWPISVVAWQSAADREGSEKGRPGRRPHLLDILMRAACILAYRRSILSIYRMQCQMRDSPATTRNREYRMDANKTLRKQAGTESIE